LLENQLVLLAVPFPYISMVAGLMKDQKNCFVSAQNIASTPNGAFTGEVSAEMLNSMDIHYAVIGHSERREYFHENNQVLADKVNRALMHNIASVFCCGEPLAIREAGTQNEYVEKQLRDSLFHLDAGQMKNIIIAYEPIWAIGTGKTASSAQAQEMHAHICQVISAKFGAEVAYEISILYGGSVKGANAAELFSQPDVDGGLVGGASLNAAEFSTIIRSLRK
jgi:triosephosphate isomerase